MQFMILPYETAADIAARTGPAQAEYWGAWSAYGRALAEAGVMVSGKGLLPPSTATTVRMRDGKRQIQDGPYADVKEQLGGFFIIEVEDLDTALQWAARAPCAPTGSVKVRPILMM